MELRHLRYFVAVADALNFTKAAARLRLAQPALSRQVKDLEEEIGVALLRRSSRSVNLTAEGKLFLEEARELLRRADQSIQNVRALARGEFGDLHVGYAPSPTVEILPPALAALRKEAPGVHIKLHDLSGDEQIAGLLDGSLDLALMVEDTQESGSRIVFEPLRQYKYCAAMAPKHPFARKKAITLEELATQPLVALSRKEYSEFYRILDRLYANRPARPKIAVECDGATSMLTELETGRGIAIVSELFRCTAGRRLVFRPLSNATEIHNIGVAWKKNAEPSAAAGKFIQALRGLNQAARQGQGQPMPARKDKPPA